MPGRKIFVLVATAPPLSQSRIHAVSSVQRAANAYRYFQRSRAQLRRRNSTPLPRFKKAANEPQRDSPDARDWAKIGCRRCCCRRSGAHALV
jgi:hypothetical protein